LITSNKVSTDIKNEPIIARTEGQWAFSLKTSFPSRILRKKAASGKNGIKRYNFIFSTL
jgi:hypothetical protein